MTAVRRRAKPHRHLLDNVGHDEEGRDEGQEEANAELRPGLGVGDHAGTIVLADDGQDARADEQPEQQRRLPVQPRRLHPYPVAGPLAVLVRDGDIPGSCRH